MSTKRDESIEIAITEIGELDIMVRASCESICKVLVKHFKKVGITTIKKESDLKKLILKKSDLVFSGIKYLGFTKNALRRQSETKIWLADYLESNGANYTASNSKSLRLDFNKKFAKEKMQENDINTAPFFSAEPNEYKNSEESPIGFPLFIKPIYEGGGKGIGKDSVVTNFAEFENKVNSIFKKFKTKALVEKYLTGREFTVGIFAAPNEDKIAMPAEIIAVSDKKGHKILGMNAKKEDNEKLIPIKNHKEHKKLSEFAKKAFKALGARDYGRIDIRMDEKGTPHFLEANLMPGLGPGGYFIKTCKINEQMSYEEAILKIVDIALMRTSNEMQLLV